MFTLRSVRDRKTMETDSSASWGRLSADVQPASWGMTEPLSLRPFFTCIVITEKRTIVITEKRTIVITEKRQPAYEAESASWHERVLRTETEWDVLWIV